VLCIIIVVNRVLELVVSSVGGSSWVPKGRVFLRIFMTMEKVLVNATDITQVQLLSKKCM
jgi:hypothetical protein